MITMIFWGLFGFAIFSVLVAIDVLDEGRP